MINEQYTSVCGPRFKKAEDKLEDLDKKVDEIHSVVTNGLRENVGEIKERMHALESRMWVMMGTITFGLLASIVLQLVRIN